MKQKSGKDTGILNRGCSVIDPSRLYNLFPEKLLSDRCLQGAAHLELFKRSRVLTSMVFALPVFCSDFF